MDYSNKLDFVSIFSKVRHTVSSTVYSVAGNISTALPGNNVTKEYEICQYGGRLQYLGCTGPGGVWKIYAGVKKSTRQEASIFVFDKKQLDKFSNKRDRD